MAPPCDAAGVLEEFLAIATSFPTSVYTVLVLISLVYWMVSVVGLAGDHGDGDADVGDAGDADFGDAGDADFGDAGDADVGDMGESDLGDAGAHSAGHAHGHGSHGADAHDGGALDAVMGLLTILRLRNAPLSITLSVLFLSAWVITYFGTLFGLPLVGGVNWLTGSALGALALLPAIPLTSLITMPLGPLFKQQYAPGRRHLVGRVGVVRIAGGKDGSAQIRLKDPAEGEKGLLIRVATDDDIHSGDEVLIVDYDEEKKAYLAEPMESVLPSKKHRG